MRTGRVGYACAIAIRDTAGSAAAPAASCRNRLRWGEFERSPNVLYSGIRGDPNVLYSSNHHLEILTDERGPRCSKLLNFEIFKMVLLARGHNGYLVYFSF